MSDPAIAVSGLGKRFGAVEALTDVAFEVPRGAIVGFIGPNGSGKTTALRILVGLVFRDAGRVTAFGSDPGNDGVVVRRRCCYLPGETNVYPQMTGRTYLEFVLGFYPRRQQQLLDALLAAFDLPLEQKVRGYSAGMKQKLALVASLAPDVDAYLLDEPDRALDATMRMQLREWLRWLADRGKTVLLSSHHLREVEAVAHGLVFLANGRRVAEERVQRARAALREELRLRLRPGARLPDGLVAEPQPDGTVRIRAGSAPLRTLARFDPADVLTAEVGMTPLEQLYQQLTDDQAAEPRP